jgi:hypothetical protein
LHGQRKTFRDYPPASKRILIKIQWFSLLTPEKFKPENI